MISFICGYSCGAGGRFDFAELSGEWVLAKYKVRSGSDGWPGQIKRLAEKQGVSWIRAFRMVALEIIAADSDNRLSGALSNSLRSRIRQLIEGLGGNSLRRCRSGWEDQQDLLSLCRIKSAWFRKIWSAGEWKMLQSIYEELQNDTAWANKEQWLLTTRVQLLTEQFLLLPDKKR